MNNFLNMGRNYFSFDSVLAMTWLNQDTGTELSAVAGFMVNTKNRHRLDHVESCSRMTF